MGKSVSKQTKQVKSPTVKKRGTNKQPKSNIVLTTLAVAATGILGYLGWQYYRKRKSSGAGSTDLNTILQNSATVYPAVTAYTDSTTIPAYVSSPSSSSSSSKKNADITAATTSVGRFPLKKGSKGTLVKALQQALIAKYGAGVLPKYGADGDFGSETVSALTKSGLPNTIDESTYYVIVQGGSSVTDKSALANKFLTAATSANFSTVLSLLKQMSTKDDYKQVSAIFSQYRLRGVRQTLVNGLLGSFSDESQKQQIRYEFIRMGLRYDGSKWSLDGIEGRTIITTEPASIWISATEKRSVPKMMVLGTEISKRLDYTLFENKGRYFLVSTKCIKYL